MRVQRARGTRSESTIIKTPVIAAWKDTLAYCQEKYYDDVGEKIDIRELTKEVAEDVLEKEDATIVVENCSTIHMTLEYSHDNKVLVLNMASDYKPGGGVSVGRTAQEETLFISTSACVTHDKNFYPLKNNDIIHSPSVKIIKNDEWKMIKEIPEIGMIACAAIRNPKLVDGKYTDKDLEIMRRKIESIFLLGIKYKYTHLVLGALGAGAFCNPVEEVVKIFSEFVSLYKHHFKFIGFAVLSYGPNGLHNYIVFKQTFA